MKYIESKDVIELCLQSYIQGYKDAAAILNEMTKSINVEDLRKKFESRLSPEPKEPCEETESK